MKKILPVLFILLIPLFLVGCTSPEEKEAKEACLQTLKDNYAKIKDDTIVSCIADYSKDTKKVVYQYCINSNEDIYVGIGKVSNGDSRYNMIKDSYNQIKNELNNSNDKYYAFEFKSSELK